MMLWIVLSISVLLILMAFAAVFSRSLASSVILLSALSLFVTLLFVLIAAPDVAITEASLGSALTTAIFILALYRTRNALDNGKTTTKDALEKSSAALRTPKKADSA